MAGFTDMPKVLFLLLVVVASCRAQGPTPSVIAQVPEVPSCTFADPAELGCSSILLIQSNRTTVSSNSIRFKGKFGSPGIAKVTVVVNIPDTLTVRKVSLSCQRKAKCSKEFCSSGSQVIASAVVARGIDLKIFFTKPVKDTPITGTVWTSCAEQVPLGWNTAPVIIDEPQIFGPEPVGAPVAPLFPAAPEAGGPTP